MSDEDSFFNEDEDSIFDEKVTEFETEKNKEKINPLVKLNTNKEIVVNIDSLQDLISTITYVTNKLEEVKGDFQPIDNDKIMKSLKPIEDNINRLKNDVHDTLENVTKQLKLVEPAVSENLIKSFIFELERFKPVDSIINKLKTSQIVLTIITTAIVTTGVIQYYDLTQGLNSYMIKKNIKRLNIVAPYSKYNVQKISNGYKLLKK